MGAARREQSGDLGGHLTLLSIDGQQSPAGDEDEHLVVLVVVRFGGAARFDDGPPHAPGGELFAAVRVDLLVADPVGVDQLFFTGLSDQHCCSPEDMRVVWTRGRRRGRAAEMGAGSSGVSRPGTRSRPKVVNAVRSGSGKTWRPVTVLRMTADRQAPRPKSGALT